MIRTATVLLALTLTLAGCSGAPRTGTSAPRRNTNVITSAELADPSINTLSLYDAIQRLRPTWLRNRGVTSVSNGSTLPQVMVNESLSTFDMLRGLRSADVSGLEFLSGADATTLYGTGYVNGLIKVRTGNTR
jgi:hypothetical protein